MNMGEIRKIKRISKSIPTMEGAGVRLNRAFGFSGTNTFDPFLLLDDFRSDNPQDYLKGFPWHPHRGIETITYMLKGEVEHQDSLGNRGIIYPDEVQWMTAGSGIIHQEMPKEGENGSMWGFQLWANLPSSHKMMDPRYREVKSDQIPLIKHKNGCEIRIIAGSIADTHGPVDDVITKPEYLDVSVPANCEFTQKIPQEKNVFAYVFDGEGYFDECRDPYEIEMRTNNYLHFERQCNLRNHTLIHFGEGDEILVTTEDSPLRFLLVSGKPIEEPVAWYGPIVMNTQEELKIAFQEYRNGTFIKNK